MFICSSIEVDFNLSEKLYALMYVCVFINIKILKQPTLKTRLRTHSRRHSGFLNFKKVFHCAEPPPGYRGGYTRGYSLVECTPMVSAVYVRRPAAETDEKIFKMFKCSHNPPQTERN